FRILVRESPVGMDRSGGFATIMSDVASQVEYILVQQFKGRGFETKLAGLYSQALVGMVALAGQWWQDHRKPKREEVAAHLVNLAWNGLSHLEHKPRLGGHGGTPPAG
ncbi:MAG: TetR/AcrR family transcriptional regulator, partial [Nocardioidaceae bacterium]